MNKHDRFKTVATGRAALRSMLPVMIAVLSIGAMGLGEGRSSPPAWSLGSRGLEAGGFDARPSDQQAVPLPQSGGGATGDLVRPEPGATEKLGAVAEIASDFDTAAEIEPAWRDGVQGAVPASAAPDVVGAFRFICMPGHVSYDDPVVYPGQPGRSHLHQWFGNTAADARSTYASLRTTGDSTCMNRLNRSAYWMPAMLDGKGHVVRPDYISVYYKRRPASDPECKRMAARGCAPIPPGLRYVFGYDMVTGRTPTGNAYFDCNGGGGVSGHFGTIAEAAKGCPAGARLGAVLNAPDCWDGKRLDSPNHRDHMATGGYGGWGYYKCPDTHPYAIPAFTMGAWYSVDEARADGWYLSSDNMPGMPRMAAGSTLHADWFGAWDDRTMAIWTDHCINRLLNCSGGDLGNGTKLKQTAPFAWQVERRLVPVPPRP